MGDITWTTRDGAKAPVKDMSTGHIQNTMAMLRRNAVRELNIATRQMLSVIPPSAEQTSIHFDETFNMLLEATWDDVVPEIYWVMDNELSKRNSNIDTES